MALTRAQILEKMSELVKQDRLRPLDVIRYEVSGLLTRHAAKVLGIEIKTKWGPPESVVRVAPAKGNMIRKKSDW